MIFNILMRSLAVNFVLAIFKIIVSVLTNSRTLLADAIHGLSDLCTDAVGLIGAKIASKKPDKFHPFGHGKMEYVTSIFISIFIITLGVIIFGNSFSLKEIHYSLYLLLFIPMSVILKFLLSNYLIRNGKKFNSNILITSGTESRFDMINTSFAFAVVLVSYFQKYVEVLKYADMLGSIVISLFTIRIGLKILFENIRSVLGEVDVNPQKNKAIKRLILKNKKIKKVENIILLKYGQDTNLIVDIVMDSNLKLNTLYKIETNIREDVRKVFDDIKYVTVNIKPHK